MVNGLSKSCQVVDLVVIVAWSWKKKQNTTLSSPTHKYSNSIMISLYNMKSHSRYFTVNSKKRVYAEKTFDNIINYNCSLVSSVVVLIWNSSKNLMMILSISTTKHHLQSCLVRINVVQAKFILLSNVEKITWGQKWYLTWKKRLQIPFYFPVHKSSNWWNSWTFPFQKSRNFRTWKKVQR